LFLISYVYVLLLLDILKVKIEPFTRCLYLTASVLCFVFTRRLLVLRHKGSLSASRKRSASGIEESSLGGCYGTFTVRSCFLVINFIFDDYFVHLLGHLGQFFVSESID